MQVERELTEAIECIYNPVTEKSCAMHIFAVDRIIRRIPKDKLKPYFHRLLSESESSDIGYRK
jgi:hypothetical protein